MLTALISNTYLIRKGLELTHTLSTADHVLKPHEVRMIISVRDELREIAERCDALDDSGIGPKDYAGAVADECSLLLRIDSGKEADICPSRDRSGAPSHLNSSWPTSSMGLFWLPRRYRPF